MDRTCFLQINLARSRLATDEAVEMACRMKVPILIVQEPYTHANKIVGMGRYSNQIFTSNITENEPPWAAVIILDRRYTGTLIRNVSTAHSVCVHVEGPQGSFYVVSLYCQYSDNIMPYLRMLERALNTICRGVATIIGSDVNGVSPLWTQRCEEADERGQEVEELIAQFNLRVANTPNEPCTYTIGARDIDITLLGGSWTRTEHLINWRVLVDSSSSDHRPILIEIGGTTTVPPKLRPRYNCKRAKWGSYGCDIQEAVKTIRDTRLNNSSEVNELARNITEIIQRAASKHIPKKRRFQKSVPWWNRELNEAKKQMNKARKEYQREKMST